AAPGAQAPAAGAWGAPAFAAGGQPGAGRRGGGLGRVAAADEPAGGAAGGGGGFVVLLALADRVVLQALEVRGPAAGELAAGDGGGDRQAAAGGEHGVRGRVAAGACARGRGV